MASHGSRTMVAVLLIACLLQTAVAVEHIVGDNDGWTFKSAGFYDDWAKSKDIKVGDTLKFNWVDNHDVVQLSPTATEACDAANAIETWTNAGVSIPLTAAGTFGYICGIGTHCSAGFMKMTVTVAAADDTPVASPPPPTTTEPPPPPPPSAASSLMQFYQPLMGASLAVFAAAVALYVY